jgi:hypothetical protein
MTTLVNRMPAAEGVIALCVVNTLRAFVCVLAMSGNVEGAQFTFTFARALPAPGSNVVALGYGDDGFLWVRDQDTGFVYQLDPMSGAMLDRFHTDVPVISDLDVSDGILYGLWFPQIYRYATASGDSLARLIGPVIAGARGITFVGEDLYVSGVLGGVPGFVPRLGRIDRTTGQLLSYSSPPDMTPSNDTGAIGPYIAYLRAIGFSQNVNVLRIVDPATGALIEDHELFVGPLYTNIWGIDASSTELFVTRRDLSQIWVWSYSATPTATASRSWGAVKALFQ